MQNGNRVRFRGRVRVRVGVIARPWVAVRVKILFCTSIAEMHNFSQFYAFRIALMQNGMEFRLAFGSVVRVRVSFRI